MRRMAAIRPTKFSISLVLNVLDPLDQEEEDGENHDCDADVQQVLHFEAPREAGLPGELGVPGARALVPGPGSGGLRIRVPAAVPHRGGLVRDSGAPERINGNAAQQRFALVLTGRKQLLAGS